MDLSSVPTLNATRCNVGEPDERTQHEGVTPLLQTKYAINGWMRAKHLN